MALFQSTRPRGARLGRVSVQSFSVCFNPRARAGATVGQFFVGLFGEVSIHAPARGATRKLRLGSQTRLVSIHAPARGATAWAAR